MSTKRRRMKLSFRPRGTAPDSIEPLLSGGDGNAGVGIASGELSGPSGNTVVRFSGVWGGEVTGMRELEAAGPDPSPGAKRTRCESPRLTVCVFSMTVREERISPPDSFSYDHSTPVVIETDPWAGPSLLTGSEREP